MDSKRCDAGYYCSGGSNSSRPVDFAYLTESGRWTGNAKCPVGYFCEIESKSPEPCPKGTIGIQSGAIAAERNTSIASIEKTCIPCPAGLYCPVTGISTSEPNETGPIICPARYYCPAGSENPIYLCSRGHYCPKGTAAEVSCPFGQYSSETGAENCQICPVGYFCAIHNGTIFPEMCPKGTYCDKPGTIVPTPCPPGTYNPISEPGNEPISSDFCIGCPAGYFCGSIGIGDLTADRECEAGFICRGNSTAKDPIGLSEGI